MATYNLWEIKDKGTSNCSDIMMVLLYVSGCFLSFMFFYAGTFGFVLQHLGVFSLNFVFDFYSYSFIILLFLISSCVLLWSYYYMDYEIAFRRFISLVLAFLSSMFFLVFFSSLYGALIGWDGLGVTSFLLVIYFKNRKSLGSGFITALSNRLGDCFLLMLLALQFSHLFNTYVLTILLLMTSMTKSAQFPFSSWLPAAMAAPTPVSALVHSSTLVTAGIYLLIRFNGMGTEWLLVVGSVTMTMAGMCACAEMDLKKIVALSTLSQLGVMMVALSLSMKSLCFFHLTTHASFKALIFMCVGIGIHSVYGSQDFRVFSGFSGVSLLPTLSLTVANISLAGFPFMSGFYSKDAILETFYNTSHSFFLLLLFLFGVGLTTAYSIKMTLLAFLGVETSGSVNLNGGGTSWVTKIPLSTLGFFSVGGGAVLGSGYSTLAPLVLSDDKMMPLIFIMMGFVGGYLLSSLKNPMLSSMWYLTPFIQKSSNTSVDMVAASVLERGLYNLSASSGTWSLSVVLVEGCRWALLTSVLLCLVIAI